MTSILKNVCPVQQETLKLLNIKSHFIQIYGLQPPKPTAGFVTKPNQT